MRRFLDTYALIEVLDGNPTYAGVADDAVTSLYNLYELHVQVACLTDETTADEVYRTYRSLVASADDRDIFAASAFKRAHAKKKFSYADALGYAMAAQRGLPFVTGDKAFRGMENLDFRSGKQGGKA